MRISKLALVLASLAAAPALAQSHAPLVTTQAVSSVNDASSSDRAAFRSAMDMVASMSATRALHCTRMTASGKDQVAEIVTTEDNHDYQDAFWVRFTAQSSADSWEMLVAYVTRANYPLGKLTINGNEYRYEFNGYFTDALTIETTDGGNMTSFGYKKTSQAGNVVITLDCIPGT